MFHTPRVVLFTKRIDAAVAFYRAIGFAEVFREPAAGKPAHVDLELDGYRIGLATVRSSLRTAFASFRSASLSRAANRA